MDRLLVLSILLGVCAPPQASAQDAPRLYVGGAIAVEGGSRGIVPGGAVPSVTGLAGVRLIGGWSAEVEVERAFRNTGRVSDAVWISLAPADASREEIERLGVRARFERTEGARNGFAAAALWRTRAPRALNGAVSVGLSTRTFDTRLVRTITSVPAGYPLIDPRWPNEDSTRVRRGTGLSLGGQLLVSISEQFTVVPEVRCTNGVISGDAPYRVCRAGVRLVWAPRFGATSEFRPSAMRRTPTG